MISLSTKWIALMCSWIIWRKSLRKWWFFARLLLSLLILLTFFCVIVFRLLEFSVCSYQMKINQMNECVFEKGTLAPISTFDYSTFSLCCFSNRTTELERSSTRQKYSTKRLKQQNKKSCHSIGFVYSLDTLKHFYMIDDCLTTKTKHINDRWNGESLSSTCLEWSIQPADRAQIIYSSHTNFTLSKLISVNGAHWCICFVLKVMCLSLSISDEHSSQLSESNQSN